MAFGFNRTDYVYEPGQFAVRGSLIDVFSYSCEYPFRIDFFGDEIDSIRTFEVETQLSRERREQITLVPEMSEEAEDRVPMAELLPEDTTLVCRDVLYIVERIGTVWEEGFSQQALIEEKAKTHPQPLPSGRGAASALGQDSMLNAKRLLTDAPTFAKGIGDFRRIEWASTEKGRKSVHVAFDTTAQPIFHKNFELLTQTLTTYLAQGYKLFILADSQKQNDRLKAILEERPEPVPFTPVTKTLHAGFTDNRLKICLFTDHQIFDRFHKYNLRSERARGGKVALTLK